MVELITGPPEAPCHTEQFLVLSYELDVPALPFAARAAADVDKHLAEVRVGSASFWDA